MVERHYPELGFKLLQETPTTQYVLDVDQYVERECYIETEKA
jgi:hypothetical protein